MTVTHTVSGDSGRGTYLGFAADIIGFAAVLMTQEYWVVLPPAMMCCLAWYVAMACSGGKSIRQQRLWEGLPEGLAEALAEGLAGGLAEGLAEGLARGTRRGTSGGSKDKRVGRIYIYIHLHIQFVLAKH